MSGRRVTVMNVAEAAGVSRSTVSLVLRDSRHVREETRGRVRQAIRDLGYIYNRGAASLRSRASDLAGMVINDLANPFYAELAIGIEDGLRKQGMVCLLAHSGEDPAREAELVATMREHGAAGVIMAPALGSRPTFVENLIRDGLPMVLVMRPPEGVAANVVTPDNTLGVRMAVEHLIRLGHRRIAFLGGRRDLAVRAERLQGYLDALRASAIAIDDDLIAEAPITRAGGAQALATVLAAPSPPTAAMCFNDLTALGALAGAWAHGRRPGEDFALIGFDDVTEARHAVPALTTVSVEPRVMGRIAAQRLLACIREPDRAVERTILAPRLAVRGSCGAGGAGRASLDPSKDHEDA